MVGPFQKPMVMDQLAFEQMQQELIQRLKLAGRTPTFEEHNRIRDRASDYAYSTEFSRICTAAIQGDWEPAKERCRRERAEKGETLARELMRSYQRAVKERRSTMRA